MIIGSDRTDPIKSYHSVPLVDKNNARKVQEWVLAKKRESPLDPDKIWSRQTDYPSQWLGSG
jgi:hypothetical protein